MLSRLFQYNFRFSCKEHRKFIYLPLNPTKIEKTLNRYNSEDNDFRPSSERSLEAQNLPL